MTVRALAACAVLVVLGLGLGVATGAQSPSTEVTTPGNGPGQQWRQDSAYLTAVREQNIQATDADLMTTARRVCEYTQNGQSFHDLVVYAQQRHSVDAVDAAFVVVAAVHDRCPEYDGATAGAQP